MHGKCIKVDVALLQERLAAVAVLSKVSEAEAFVGGIKDVLVSNRT